MKTPSWRCATKRRSGSHIRLVESALVLSIAFSFLCLRPANAADLKATDAGLAIDAGSLGAFTLSYPVLLDSAQKPVHKLVETRPAGKSATLKYEGGGQIDLAIASSGEVTLKFSNTSTDVKSYHMEMLIDLALSKGGRWKIGDKESSFPREKPAKPHLYQGNHAQFKFSNAAGQSLSFRAPDYAYQQLTDNREWGWGIFAWRCIVPFNPNQPQSTIIVRSEGTSGATIKLVDQFGQSTLEAWPDKVKTMEELKADVASERAYYEGLHPPQRDRFGGLLDSAARLSLKKTGYFHVEQHGGKWWLIDPDGNAFFHMGVCGFIPNDDYTYVKGRENIYEWLPSQQSEFKTAFRPADSGAVFSFHLANSIRKFDQPYTHEDYSARMIERVRKWGFNSIGAFSAIPKAAQAVSFPYVSHLPLNEWDGGIRRIPGVRETFDPFDDDTRQRVEKNLASKLPASASDPLLIGYFIVNEPAYEDIPTIVPSLNGKHACKRRLVEMLSEKYKTIAAFNLAWNAQAKSFEELNEVGLAVRTPAASGDMQAFTSLFLDSYFSLVRDAFRRHDTNHLLLGSRLQPVTIKSGPLCRIIGKYVDVMSYNYYTDGVDKALLKQIYQWTGGRPMMLSEFFWASPRDSGLVGGREVKTQQERGLAYRNYIEQSASLGFVVGLEWFTLVDQSVTGRWFSKYSGESSNSGLISVTDRPWKAMLTEMTKSNYDIYSVLLGERTPFALDDVRFK